MSEFSLMKEKEVPELVLWEKYLVYATVFVISEKVLKQLKVVYPQLTDEQYMNSYGYTYLYLMYSGSFNNSFLSSLNTVVSSSYNNITTNYSSGLGGGGGFSGGGGFGGGGGRNGRKITDMTHIIKKEKEMNQIPEFLQEKLQNQYGEEISKQIIKGYEKKRPVTLRINTLKTNIEQVKKSLTLLQVTYKEVPWSKEALIIEDIRENTLLQFDMYQNGEIYLQSLSSMLPPIILEPKPNADILDMTAAPGGKTTQLAALSQNQSHITACEFNKIRMERLKYNVEKQGATSVYTMEKDAKRLDDFFSFNQILLDAPCSGSGTLATWNERLQETFTKKRIQKSVTSQKALLKKAITILKPGGEMVYSTCSILKEENEEMIKPFLKEKRIEIVPIKLKNSDTIPLLPISLQGTICICPNKLYEGFFIAKLKKL